MSDKLGQEERSVTLNEFLARKMWPKATNPQDWDFENSWNDCGALISAMAERGWAMASRFNRVDRAWRMEIFFTPIENFDVDPVDVWIPCTGTNGLCPTPADIAQAAGKALGWEKEP